MRGQWGPAAVAAVVGLFLLVFLVLPVVNVIYVAFQDPNTGALTLINFVDFFRTSLFRESFVNSVYVASMAVVVSSCFALPLAYFTSRFNFKGALLIQTLGIIPLIMPPFVGAVAMLLLLGENGSVNLLLDEWFGFTIPFMEGLNGVILVESIHYFPFILINLSAALNNIDRSMEESAQNLGASGLRLFRRIVFPLAMPGYVAGASLVFLKVFDDLGTPLLLNVNDMLAPQAYLRITSIGIADPMGYVISVILVVLSLLALWTSFLALRNKDYAMLQKGGGGLMKRDLRPWEKAACYGVVIFILLLVLSPHFGLSAPVLRYRVVVQRAARRLHRRPLPAGGVVLVPVHHQHVALRRPRRRHRRLLRHRHRVRCLAHEAHRPAVARLHRHGGGGHPGRGAGHRLPADLLRVQRPHHRQTPGFLVGHHRRRPGHPPNALRAARLHRGAAADQRHAGGGGREPGRHQGPHGPSRRSAADGGGIVAGFVTSFATAAVELSTTIMLVSQESDAPLAFGIYEFMQSAAGRGPGAALGIVAVVIVGITTYVSYRFIQRRETQRTPDVTAVAGA